MLKVANQRREHFRILKKLLHFPSKEISNVF
jgi:hypothetical protein